MKKVSLLLCFLMTAIIHQNVAQISTPAASPAATLSQVVGLTKVEISYSRPAMKGRKIYGELVPFGNVWRTGANAATKISFSEPMSFEGNQLEAGDYSIFTIPAKGEWTIILNKDPQASFTNYDQSKDALRFTAKTQKSKMDYETFTIMFSDIKDNKAKLNILWENTLVQFDIEDPDVDEKVMAQIQSQIPNAGNNDNIYYAAASYYFENDKDINQAAEWIDKSVSINNEKYWVMHLQAKIHAKLNHKEKAIEAAERSKELADAAGNPDYVKLNDKLIASLK